MNLKNLFRKKLEAPLSLEEKAELFWNWFTRNQKPYLFITQIEGEERERLLNEFLEKLHDFQEQLFFEMGGHPDDKKVELVITAGGKVEYFDKVELLVSKAPILDHWKVIAFKPPMGSEFSTRVEGHEFDPKELFFIPLESQEHPGAIGLEVCFPNFDKEKEQTFLFGTFLMLDVILGEKSCALDIDFIEVGGIPENIHDLATRPLPEVKAYIDEMKKHKE